MCPGRNGRAEGEERQESSTGDAESASHRGHPNRAATLGQETRDPLRLPARARRHSTGRERERDQAESPRGPEMATLVKEKAPGRKVRD